MGLRMSSDEAACVGVRVRVHDAGRERHERAKQRLHARVAHLVAPHVEDAQLQHAPGWQAETVRCMHTGRWREVAGG